MGAVFQRHHITHASTLLHKMELLREKKLMRLRIRVTRAHGIRYIQILFKVSIKPFRRAHAKKFEEALNRLIQAT